MISSRRIMGSHPQHQMLCGSVYQTTWSGAGIVGLGTHRERSVLSLSGLRHPNDGKRFYRLAQSRIRNQIRRCVVLLFIRIAESLSVRKRSKDLPILRALLAPSFGLRLLDVGGGAGT